MYRGTTGRHWRRRCNVRGVPYEAPESDGGESGAGSDGRECPACGEPLPEESGDSGSSCPCDG